MGNKRISFVLPFFFATLFISFFIHIFPNPALADTPVYTYNNIGTAELTQIKNRLVAAGYSDSDAQKLINAAKPEKKTAYQVGTSLFIGDQESIKGGNYTVAGVNYFSADKKLYLLYLIDYKEHKPFSVNLSDGRIIDFENGSLYNFKITWRSQDNRRVYVANYKEGRKQAILNIAKYDDPRGVQVKLPDLVPGAVLQSSFLILKDFDLTLSYDSEGNLTQQSLAALRKNPAYATIPGNDYNTMQTGIGFALINKKSGKEERYTFSGRRMLPDVHGDGQREVMENDIKDEMILKFSKYGDARETSVSIDNIHKQRMEFLVSREGKVSRVVTRTRVLCDDIEQYEEESVQNAATKQNEWIVKPKPNLEKFVTGVKFFESGSGMLPFDKRVYRTEFAAADTKYINWELNMTHPQPGRLITYDIEALWLRGDERSYAKEKVRSVIEPQWKHSSTWSGWGSSKPGTWPAGKYTVEFYADGKKVAKAAFTVK